MDLNNLAALYQATGHLAAAEPLYQRALAITEAALGPDHPSVAICLNNLAGLYRASGRLAAAEPLFQRALEIFRNVLGDDHPNTKTVANNLASLRTKTEPTPESGERRSPLSGLWQAVVKLFR